MYRKKENIRDQLSAITEKKISARCQTSGAARNKIATI
jgi:hypothetical protein